MSRHCVMSIVGTRPEAIKMGPVISELASRPEAFEHVVVTTAQHRELLDQVLDLFRVEPDVDLGLMEEDQSLGDFAARALAAVSKLLDDVNPDAVLVQGDTTTVTTAALAAFYRGIRVGHVEAGLRSFDRRNPFPEEINRRVAGCVADLHFAPTEGARRNLLREGVRADTIFVTGNTIVDALKTIPADGPFREPHLGRVDFGRRVLLVTAHRRESHGRPLRSICAALRRLVSSFADVEVVYPVHLNPNVRSVVMRELGGVDRIHLVNPLAYVDLIRVMRRSYLILTDSGGIQEEAPSFGKPVLVLRETTERPELIEAGLGRIVGTSASRIVAAATSLFSDEDAYRRMSEGANPFGDGRAAGRIVDILGRALASSSPVQVEAAEGALTALSGRAEPLEG